MKQKQRSTFSEGLACLLAILPLALWVSAGSSGLFKPWHVQGPGVPGGGNGEITVRHRLGEAEGIRAEVSWGIGTAAAGDAGGNPSRWALR